MKQTLTKCIRQTLDETPRATVDNVSLIFAIFERYGLILTDEQREQSKFLPDPYSIVRIGIEERKVRKQQKKEKS